MEMMTRVVAFVTGLATGVALFVLRRRRQKPAAKPFTLNFDPDDSVGLRVSSTGQLYFMPLPDVDNR